MPRAIDMHVHLPTASFLEGAIGPFRAPAEKFFRTTVPLREMEEVARHYEELDILDRRRNFAASSLSPLEAAPTPVSSPPDRMGLVSSETTAP